MKVWFVVAGALCAMGGATRESAAQTWDTSAARELVDRAIARRRGAVEGGGLIDYTASARGMVLFLTQFGSGISAPPRMAKADEIVLDLFWRRPGWSKQRIVGRRHRTELPTDIRYHRDHLGIVQNSFGERIRLGDGHEVRDVLHPIAPGAPAVYEYGIVDSITLRSAEQHRTVVKVAVRPKTPDAAGVVGSVFLDAGTAEIVRFAFGFTRASYVDGTVEDITVSLEHALWDDRYWLPREQIIEIRRHTSWFDFPARSIIRARWEIDEYRFNPGLDPQLFTGVEIVPAETGAGDFEWGESLDAALRRFHGPVEGVDVDAVRRELATVVGAAALSGLPRMRVGGQGVSDLVHVNRVEGVALGVGATRRWRGLRLRAWVGYGLGDGQGKGRAEARWLRRTVGVRVFGGREVADISDTPVVSRAVNSLLAQEAARDLGDYYRRDRVGVAEFVPLTRSRAELFVRYDRVTPAVQTVNAARGRYRPNPDLGSGSFWVVGGAATLRGGPDGGGEYRRTVEVSVERGSGVGNRYGRAAVAGHLLLPAGRGTVAVRAVGGAGTRNLPPHRSFVMGGPGTLPGERFRRWGGRAVASTMVEWQIPVSVPAGRVGSFVTTGDRIWVGPFVGAGTAHGAMAGLPWIPSGGPRVVAGVALEWFHRMVRIEAGYSFRDRRVRVSADLARVLWEVL